MTVLPEPQPIREVSGISRWAFETEIRAAAQPVVIRGLAADWPSVLAARESDEAALAYLMRFSDGREVSALIGAPEIEGRFFYAPDMQGFNFARGQVPIAAFFERLLGDRGSARPYSLAVQSAVIPELLPGFVGENRIDLVDASVEPRLWIGNAIRVAPHYDLMENVGVVVIGRRRFTLFPPEQLPNLYMGPMEVTPAGTPVSMVELANPDLERYPRFAEAAKHAQSAVLEPGDAIYIPFHWWHAVDSLDGVNAFANYWWNDARSDVGRPYDAMLHALYAFRGLPEDQRRVWQMVFESLVFATDGEPLDHLPPHQRGVLGPPDPTKVIRMRETLKQIVGKY